MRAGSVVIILLLLPTALQRKRSASRCLIGNRTYDASVGVLKNPHNDIAVVGEAIANKGSRSPIRDGKCSAILGGVRKPVRKLTCERG